MTHDACMVHDDACCMIMRESRPLQRVSRVFHEQDYVYDAEQDVAEHPQDVVWRHSATRYR